MNIMAKKKGANRSWWGSTLVIILLALAGLFMVLPLVLTIINAFKPLNELFIFPPRFYVVNPTFNNFSDMFALIQSTRVPFERYLFNSLFITVFGTTLYIMIASIAAYPLAKHKFHGKTIFVNLVIWGMLFRPEVLALPQYLIIAKFDWLNTYFAVIIPALASSMGVFLMRQFIVAFVPNTLLEAAKIDGAGEYRVFYTIIMPMVKPAWLTLVIFTFQSLWNQTGSSFIYNEEMKVLPTALSQISSGGIARAGVASAVALFLLIPPVVLFLFTQSSIIETMAHSGIK